MLINMEQVSSENLLFDVIKSLIPSITNNNVRFFFKKL